MTDLADRLRYPLYKSFEPNISARGNQQFDVPIQYVNERFQSSALEMETRFGDNVEKIPVKEIDLPKLVKANKLPEKAVFSVFNKQHQEYASELIDIFMSCETHDDLLATAVYIRDQVNSYLFTYAYSVALLHRKDTINIDPAPLAHIHPERVLFRSIINQAVEENYVVPGKLRRSVPTEKHNRTATERELEQLMAYFREDIGVNSHHWHWHLVYPGFAPPSIPDMDRRGELFYYMHQQVLARYNTDRLCHNMNRVKPVDLRRAIEVGYFPKMSASNSSRQIIGRQENVQCQDVVFADFPALKVEDLYLWWYRIREAIQQGYMINDQNEQIRIDNIQGIDFLGNTIEDSAKNVNSTYYGNIHGTGHVLIASCHDPKNQFIEQAAVMADTATAMRDPVFYQWHAFVNDIFFEHKLTLPPYTDNELAFSNITVSNVQIIIRNKYVNEFETFWQKSDINLSAGLDFTREGSIRVTYKHIQHEPFRYKITVQNKGEARYGTVRIFMSPVLNEAKTEFSFEGLRQLAIELDRFVVHLDAGENKIYRYSEESASIVPFDQIFPPITVNEEGVDQSFTARNRAQRFCACGWPEYFLLPIGTSTGFRCKLFVMISDYAQDKVLEEVAGVCDTSAVFCGRRDKLYPDKRPMGFPFDRANFQFNTLEEFKKDNMFIKECTIKHFDEVKVSYKADEPIVKLSQQAGPATGQTGSGQASTGQSASGTNSSARDLTEKGPNV